MVIVKIGDGLGNQLFNYACGYAAAKKNNDSLRLDITECDNSSLRNYELEKNFQIDCHDTISYSNSTLFHKVYKRLWRDIGHHVIYERSIGYDSRVYTRKKFRNIYLYGYWQDLRYFDFCKDDILRQFCRKGEPAKEVAELQDRLSKTKTCALHFRAGDSPLLTPERFDYCKQAMKMMIKRIPDVQIIVFTDNYCRVKETFDAFEIRNLIYIHELAEKSDIDEFFLLSACQNQIVSNSTYSWWAAYLNSNPEKIVIAPFTTACGGQYYPEDWIQI